MYKIGKFTIYGEHEDDLGGDLNIKILPHSHQSAYGWWNKSTKDVLNFMSNLPIRGAKVLDLGCGSSAILAIAAKKMGAAEVVACEIHPELLEIAQKQIDVNGGNIELIQYDDNREYDIILANIGNAEEVEKLSKRAKISLGTDIDGNLIKRGV